MALITCPGCRASLKVKDDAAGNARKLTCPRCATKFLTKRAASASPPAAEPRSRLQCPKCKRKLKTAGNLSNAAKCKCPYCGVVFSRLPRAATPCEAPATPSAETPDVAGESIPSASNELETASPTEPDAEAEPAAPVPAVPQPRRAKRKIEAEPGHRIKALVYAGLALGAFCLVPACYWFFFAGGPGGTVTGTVYFKGQPISAGQVTAVDADNGRISADINAQGGFELRNVPFGPVKFLVRCPPEEMKNAKHMSPEEWNQFKAVWGDKQFNMLPAHYFDPASTPLQFNVERRRSVCDLRLEE